jgi:DNA-binding response OmpR family regulator
MPHPRARVLVVDDAPDTLEVLARMLTHAGYAVLSATNVATARRILRRTDVDVVVTDLKLPRVGGLALVQTVRDHHPRTAVLAVTGYPYLDQELRDIRAAVDGFVAKPFTAEELRLAVRSTAERVRDRPAVDPASCLPSHSLDDRCDERPRRFT